MSPKRIRQRLADFEKALKRLKEVLAEDPSKTTAIIDGTIQRFEFTFELSWKLARDVLYHNGIETNNPRSAIKEAFKENLITEAELWINMMEDRNRTSHIYDEAEAFKIYQKIKESYYFLLENFFGKVLPIVSQMGGESQSERKG